MIIKKLFVYYFFQHGVKKQVTMTLHNFMILVRNKQQLPVHQTMHN